MLTHADVGRMLQGFFLLTLPERLATAAAWLVQALPAGDAGARGARGGLIH